MLHYACNQVKYCGTTQITHAAGVSFLQLEDVKLSLSSPSSLSSSQSLQGGNELRGGGGNGGAAPPKQTKKKTISLPIFPPLAISFNPSYSHPSALSVLLDVVFVLTTLRRQRKIVEGRKEGVEMLMLRRLRPSTSRVASTRHSIPSILYPSFHHSPPKKGTKLLQPNAWLLFAPT